MKAMYDLPLIAEEIISAIICFVLLRFMIKPYRTTGERQYLGLPLGFAFLGISYALAAVALYSQRFAFFQQTQWLQVFTQAYAFGFIAITYLFSNKPPKNMSVWRDIVITGLIIAGFFVYLEIVEPPTFGLPSFKTEAIYTQLFNILCLGYVTIHTLRMHELKPNPETLWVPIGYLLLGFSQYSLLIWSVDSSTLANVGSQILRLAGLSMFLFVSYRSFYSSKFEILRIEDVENEENSA